MKKIKNALFLFFIALFVLSGCKITAIEADEDTTSVIYDINDFELEDIKLLVTKKGSQKTSISLSEEMISTADLLLLDVVGSHDITVRYHGLETLINIKLKFADVNYQLLDIYQKLVMYNSYSGSYENWVGGLTNNGLQITEAIINSEERVKITFSDGSQIDAGKISAPTSTDTVNILSINDTHGAFYTEDSPGLEKVQSAIEFLEKQYGNHIKIANGDIFQGSYVSNVNYGLPLLEALNLMEFDAFVLGNHEFDWGIEKIEQYADGDLSNGEADFPFLAANIVYKRGGERLPWTEDYVVVEENGYRVGIIGVIGYNLESSIASDKVADYTFLHPVSIVQEHSKTLREELDCDFVFVATHNYVDWENNAYLSLPDESRIDGIICGHTHQRVGRNVFRSGDYYAPIMQSDDKNESIGQMIIHLDDDNNPFIAYTYHHNPLHFPSDLDIINLIIDYANDIEEGNRVIGYTPENLNKSNIGLEMTKAMKEKYDADVTFINTAGVRDTLDTGNIRVKDVFEVFPFDNIIIVASVKGDLLRDLYYKQGSYLYFNPDMDINNIKDNQDYKIVTIDYIYTGSYYLKYFENSIREDHELMRDVFIEYLENYFLK